MYIHSCTCPCTWKCICFVLTCAAVHTCVVPCILCVFLGNLLTPQKRLPKHFGRNRSERAWRILPPGLFLPRSELFWKGQPLSPLSNHQLPNTELPNCPNPQLPANPPPLPVRHLGGRGAQRVPRPGGHPPLCPQRPQLHPVRLHASGRPVLRPHPARYPQRERLQPGPWVGVRCFRGTDT